MNEINYIFYNLHSPQVFYCNNNNKNMNEDKSLMFKVSGRTQGFSKASIASFSLSLSSPFKLFYFIVFILLFYVYVCVVCMYVFS